MSAASTSTDIEFRIKGGLWASAWKIALGVGLLGMAGVGAGFAQDGRRAAFSYLFAFAVFLTMALGSLFFVLIQHLTNAWWSVTLRRTAEFLMSALPVFALLFVPIAAGVDHLYPWAQHHGAAHGSAAGGQHGAAAAHGGHDAPAAHGDHAAAPAHGAAAGHGGHGAAPAVHDEHVAPRAHIAEGVPSGRPLTEDEIDHHNHGELLGKKSAYLNKARFFGFALLYFLVWTFLSQRFYNNSLAQDGTKDIAYTKKNQAAAPASVALFALSLTFAVFDWYMSLLPQWYSTIFGVQLFSAAFVAALAAMVLIALSFRNNGLTGNAINTEHFHDLGKLLFGFTCFWAYISFSQFFLIWYASIPEETLFFHLRWSNGPWKSISLAVVVLHFVVPFFLLISRNVKRYFNQRLLQLGAALLLVIHVVEMYWLVLPNYAMALQPGMALEEVARRSDALSLHWLDLASLLGVGGVYLAVVFYRMSQASLVPVGDPRLQRSLRLQNA